MAASARPARNPGAILTGIDADLRTRLTVAANDAMTRALEKAGARFRSRAIAHRAALRHVPGRLVAATLGPTIALTAATHDEAFAGAWDELHDQFMAWGAQAQEEAIEVVSKLVAGFDVAERAGLQLRQAGDLTEAWEWLRVALGNLAAERLFDPTPVVDALGEFDATLKVPTGMIRQAIARAGGAQGLVTTDNGGAAIVLTDGGARPAGGIGTGELVRGALRDHGIGVEGYRWVYGPARRSRPFEPHRSLDGLVFVNFDDEALANTDGWPEFAYWMPGDHAGCVCDVEPILIPPSTEADE